MNSQTISHWISATVALLISVVLATATNVSASPSPKNEKSAQQQIAELQAKVKQLEATLAAQSHASPSGSPAMAAGGGMQMGGMRAGGGMQMQSGASASPSMPGMSPSAGGGMQMEDDMQMGGGMSTPSGSPAGMQGMGNMMGQMDQMMGMNMMGMHSMQGMSMPQSALPGFPGVSHLYHIGATGFFLDHADHIKLTPAQQSALTKIKQEAMESSTHSQHQIQDAENELAQLTSADQPDAAKIDKKVREIEKLRSDERLAFIRSVGNAAKLLTDDQRKILVGVMQPNDTMPMPSATMSPMSDM